MKSNFYIIFIIVFLILVICFPWLLAILFIVFMGNLIIKGTKTTKPKVKSHYPIDVKELIQKHENHRLDPQKYVNTIESLFLPQNYISIKSKNHLLPILEKQARMKLQELKISKIYYRNLKEDIVEKIDQHNKDFIRKELRENSSLFDNILGYALDTQQRNSIVQDEDYSLVIAGAGSGKTLTIVGKVAYLCAKKHISPKEILLISFTNKAADEMTERLTKQLNIPITAYTFHKLGIEIIKKNSSSIPHVADSNTLEKVIDSYYHGTLENSQESTDKLLHFLAYYLYVPVDKEKENSLGDLIEAERSGDLETLKSKYERSKQEASLRTIVGEKMKSQEEVMIANFLFLNGIKYEYEKPYPHTTNFSYRPDFYLPDYDIYLEHFGINRQGKCPWLPPIEAKKYTSTIIKKRKTHKDHGTRLLETYSYYQTEGILLEKLKEMLLENEVKFQPLPIKDVLEKILEQEDRRLSEFKRLVSSFIHLFKANGYTDKDFARLIDASTSNNHYLSERAKFFLLIAQDIFREYQKFLLENDFIDFSDMIWQATALIKQGTSQLPYKYIIIDEYQDIGHDRYQMIKAILNQTQAKLICIGDDWQSIYRFAGSDINLFTHFGEYWGKEKTFYLENTYRNSQDLIDICTKFIGRNPSQIQKKLVSHKRITHPLAIINCAEDKQIKTIQKILEKIYKQHGKSSVLILGRHNKDISFLKEAEKKDDSFPFHTIIKPDIVEIKYNKTPDLDITFLTVHKAKGLEADNVILINCKNAYLGFPNKIDDDPILQLMLGNTETFAYAEERRLMYVALTRTKNHTYLLVPKENPSEFVSELIQLGVPESKDVNITEYSCPLCKTGKLVLRTKNESSFYGCTNYPSCWFTCKEVSDRICNKCGGFMLLKKGKYSDFYGCSNYPHCRNTMHISNPKSSTAISNHDAQTPS